MKDLAPYLKDIEVAKRYNISRPTIWRWVKNEKFPRPIKLGEGSTRWRLSDLERWELSLFQTEG